MGCDPETMSYAQHQMSNHYDEGGGMPFATLATRP
jgi:hypothetical protein